MMDGDILGTAIYNALKAIYPNMGASDEVVWKAIGGAIVSHIVSTGQVNFPIPVQVNPATGTGATTATGTIS